jgi:hypothetical protein
MKYEMTKDSIQFEKATLYRIKAIESFSDVKEGDLGGYIEKPENLSQEGNCWIYDQAKVMGKSCICNSARVLEDAVVIDSDVIDTAQVWGAARLEGGCCLSNDACVAGNDIKINKRVSQNTMTSPFGAI